MLILNKLTNKARQTVNKMAYQAPVEYKKITRFNKHFRNVTLVTRSKKQQKNLLG